LDVPPLSRYAVERSAPGLLFGLTAFNTRAIQRGVATMAQTFDVKRSS
jgi:hypothetical protein